MLAKLFLQNQELFKTQFANALELGSGTGVCGLYYSIVNNVICTDYKESLLENILYNKTINEDIDGKDDFLQDKQLQIFIQDAENIKKNMKIGFLDWFNPLKEEPDMEMQTRSYLPDNIYDISPYLTKVQNQRYELIFGSEISYCESTAQALAQVINMYLTENGIFMMIVSKYRGHGVNSFLQYLKQFDFNMFCYNVPEQFQQYRNKNMKNRGEEYVFIVAHRDNQESEQKYNQIKQMFQTMEPIDISTFQFKSSK